MKNPRVGIHTRFGDSIGSSGSQASPWGLYQDGCWLSVIQALPPHFRWEEARRASTFIRKAEVPLESSSCFSLAKTVSCSYPGLPGPLMKQEFLVWGSKAVQFGKKERRTDIG